MRKNFYKILGEKIQKYLFFILYITKIRIEIERSKRSRNRAINTTAYKQIYLIINNPLRNRIRSRDRYLGSYENILLRS